ncbi:hypothetical protein HPULCUR_010883 [Helicostylum pulchrum]|uniref:Uncharacterized protein n=1 Tax=Helicostylum pulchrum TaxID=562976 RepID=A0ABP9YEI9_9FUNG
MFDLSLIDTAAVNNSSGFCICLNANIISITENHQPAANDAPITVNETENHQPIASTITTVHEAVS